MPDPVTALIGGGSLISGAMGASASKSAARSQERASEAATAEERRQYDQTRQDMAPWQYVGGQALNTMASELGLMPYAAPTAQTGRTGLNRLGTAGQFGVGDYPMPSGVTPTVGQQTGKIGSFQASPGYGFVRDEGMRGIERSAAARGGAFSGNALRGLNAFNSGLASQEYGNWWNRLAGLSGTAQSGAGQLGVLGANMASNIGNNLRAAGDARASGITGAANSWGNTLNDLAYGLGRWKKPTSPTTQGVWI